jgi:TRAP-type mannitol/chloroaromatic compound transport system permease small subunit
VVALVTGILALIPCCNLYIMWLVAIVTGVLAKGEIKKKPDELKGDGMALAGIIMGAVSLVIMIILTIVQLSMGALDAFF